VKENGESWSWGLATLVASSLFGALAAHGLDQCDRNLATNRAWVSPCLLGLGIACFSIVPFLGALLAGRSIKNAFVVMLYFVVIGVSPSVTILILTYPRWLGHHYFW